MKTSKDINWRDSLDDAVKEAKSGDKPVYLDFFNPS